MIVTQTRKRRSYIGSLNAGADLVDSLSSICVDNAIVCATFHGTGYVANPALRTYSFRDQRLEPPIVHEGHFHLVALHGNVSLHERATVIKAHAIGTLHAPKTEPRVLSGELVAGSVVLFEFTLSSVDDLRLYRAHDDRTGLEPWLHMDLGTGPPPSEREVEEIPVIQSSPGSARPSPPATLPTEELGSDTPIEVAPGDWLQHPTLGQCEVVENDQDHRVTIRLESGRVVELHVGLLQLQPAGKARNGGRIFKVAIKRKK
jgi:predicted DNA-binding protein with PD1-like motif